MNLIELNRALRQLRLGGIAAVLETRLHQAQAEPMAPIDFLSCLVSDELTRRGDRLLERRRKQAQFRDPQKTLDNFDFDFNKKMNRSLPIEQATAAFLTRREDALFLGPPGTGKSHLAQAIGHAVIGQGYRVIYREAHILLEEIAEASIDGTRKEHMELLAAVPLLIIDDLGMRKLASTASMLLEPFDTFAQLSQPLHRSRVRQAKGTVAPTTIPHAKRSRTNAEIEIRQTVHRSTARRRDSISSLSKIRGSREQREGSTR